jgi:hypothetical protein
MEENTEKKPPQKYVEGRKKDEVTQGYESQSQQAYPPNPYYPPYSNYYNPPQTSQQPQPGVEGEATYTCPTCGKAGYYYPNKPKGGLKDKKFLKIPIVVWIVALFIVVIFSCLIIAFLALPPGGPESEVFDEEVIIADGGHFRYSIGFYLEDEITFNISSRNGNNFDIYIMDEDQYENAYETPNSRIISFSTHYSDENINNVTQTLDFSDENSRFSEYFLVIDNRDTRITPDDATPRGTITVDVHITIEYTYYIY